MRYKTTELGEAGVDVNLDLSATWLAESCPELEGELGPDGLRLDGRIERTGDDFLLRGSLRGALRMQCVRCLESTVIAVDVGIAVQFIEDDPNLVESNDEDDDDDGDLVRFADGIIDLTDEIREEICLALPMSPRCEPECGGICAVCGRNRDRDPCDCEERQRAAMSPFANLAKLKS